MRLVFISDTHLRHQLGPIEVPEGDVLIHCGDATFRGTIPEISIFSEWFKSFNHKHKIFVAGNHDWLFQTCPEMAIKLLPKRTSYLCDSGKKINGIRFWGSPWQPEFMGWAFNLPRGPALKRHWDMIPDNTDVLITHSPPLGIGDNAPDSRRASNRVGDQDLLETVLRIKPKVHVFGHIHNGYGKYNIKLMEPEEKDFRTTFINASLCDERYQAVNKPIVIDL